MEQFGDMMGGFCPGGFCPREDFVQGDFVRGILSRGFCPGDFVLEPSDTDVFQKISCLMRYSLVISDAAAITTSFPMPSRSNIRNAWRYHLQYQFTQHQVTDGKNAYYCCLVQVINNSLLIHFMT